METKKVTLTFKRKELLYDIKNNCYIDAEAPQKRPDGDTNEAHDRHQVQAVGDAGNVDRVTRVLDLTFAQCVELCYPYTKAEVVEDMSQDDTLHESDYVMVMNVPEGFSQTTVKLLLKSIHELLVDKVVADWMSINKPDSFANWQTKAEAAEESVVGMLNARTRPVRRRPRPF